MCEDAWCTHTTLQSGCHWICIQNVFSCCVYLHVHTHCIAIVEDVVFWTSTRTRFPKECVEILVNMPVILKCMLLIMSLTLYFCWLAFVSDMALLRISEKRVILTTPPPPPYLYWMVWRQYVRWSYMILSYEFLNMYPALTCAHSKKKTIYFCSFSCVSKLMYLIRVSRKCFYIRASRKFWQSTYTMPDSVICNM